MNELLSENSLAFSREPLHDGTFHCKLNIFRKPYCSISSDTAFERGHHGLQSSGSNDVSVSCQTEMRACLPNLTMVNVVRLCWMTDNTEFYSMITHYSDEYSHSSLNAESYAVVFVKGSFTRSLSIG